jgi:hypothetical protein
MLPIMSGLCQPDVGFFGIDASRGKPKIDKLITKKV